MMVRTATRELRELTATTPTFIQLGRTARMDPRTSLRQSAPENSILASTRTIPQLTARRILIIHGASLKAQMVRTVQTAKASHLRRSGTARLTAQIRSPLRGFLPFPQASHRVNGSGCGRRSPTRTTRATRHTRNPTSVRTEKTGRV